MNAPHGNFPHDPFETRLRQRLQSTPVDLPEPAGPMAAAERATQRSRRRRTAMVSVAAVAVLGGLSPLVLGSDDDDGVTTEYAASIDTDGVELDWQVYDDGLAQTFFGSATQGSSGFYVLSTAPSTTRVENPDTFTAKRAIYRLGDDGWIPVELDDGDPVLARLSERNGTLYGLSTAAETGGPVGSFSTDGGQSWSQVALDDITAPSDEVEWEMGVAVELASTAQTTVALVNVAFRPPAEDLFPELSQDTESGVSYYSQAGETGLELVRLTMSGTSAGAAGVSTNAPPESVTTATEGSDRVADEDMRFGDPSSGDTEEVIRTIPWSDLGVSGPGELSSTITYQADGGTWTPIAGAPDRNGGVIDFTSSDDAVLLTTASATSPFGTDVHYTTDGTQWHQVATPEGASSNNRHPSMGVVPGGSLLQVAAPYEKADLTVDDIVARVSDDLGASWSAIDLAALVPDSDSTLGTVSVSSGPLGVAVWIQTLDASGDEVSDRKNVLLFSADLRSWSVTDLSTVVPEDTRYLSAVRVGTDRVVALGHGQPGHGQTKGETMTLVATPVR